MSHGDNNFWSLMAALARRRGIIVGLVLAAVICAVVVSLFLPKWYEARAELLPGEGESMPVSRYTSQADLPSISGLLTLPAVVTPADVYARMLRSRAITEPIIEKFNLRERYNVATFTDAYLALVSHARFIVTEEGLLTILVEDKDPQVAADMANGFVDELNRVIADLLTGRAKQKREFIEARITQVKNELDSARAALERFQKNNRTIDFDHQTRLAIDQAVQLKIDLARVDINLDLQRKMLGDENPRIQELRRQRAAIKQQLDRIETGGGADSSFFNVPLAALPGLKGQYESLYSKVRVGESLYEILLEQLEQAKIQESEQAPAIAVLDRATPPEFRSRPKRTMIVAGTAAIAFIVAVFLALLFEYVDRLAREGGEEAQQALFVLNAFLGWLPGMKGTKKPRA